MDTIKQRQNKTWASLAEGDRERIIEDYGRYDYNTFISKEFKSNYKKTFEDQFGKHNLTKDSMTWEDVYAELFPKGSTSHYISDNGIIIANTIEEDSDAINNLITNKQGGKILSMIKIMNVAAYLNGLDWHVKSNSPDKVYYPYYQDGNICIGSKYPNEVNSFVVFRTEEIARQALNILGTVEFLSALSLNWWK